MIKLDLRTKKLDYNYVDLIVNYVFNWLTEVGYAGTIIIFKNIVLLENPGTEINVFHFIFQTNSLGRYRLVGQL